MSKLCNSSDSAEPVFRPLRAQTPCYWCEHAGGYGAASVVLWLCAAKDAMGRKFKRNPNPPGVVETLVRCPDYGRRKGAW